MFHSISFITHFYIKRKLKNGGNNRRTKQNVKIEKCKKVFHILYRSCFMIFETDVKQKAMKFSF